jgi:hypothetical protein
VRRNQWRSLTTDDAIQAALDWLEDEDWLRSEATGGTGPGSGRRTLRYRIRPAIKGKRKGHGARTGWDAHAAKSKKALGTPLPIVPKEL